jgi:NAD(P)-dependent dehydrogenase (short-subunit alcohol dehydrogenase family)
VQAGVRRLAARVLDSYPRLDVLVNSVGGFWAHRQFGEVCAGLERGVHGNLALFGAPGVPPGWHGDVVHARAVALAPHHYRCIRLHRAGYLEQMGQPGHVRPLCPLQSGRWPKCESTAGPRLAG